MLLEGSPHKGSPEKEGSMNEITDEQGKATAAVALTSERLDTMLREARKDEARLKRILEVRRLKRRSRTRKVK